MGLKKPKFGFLSGSRARRNTLSYYGNPSTSLDELGRSTETIVMPLEDVSLSRSISASVSDLAGVTIHQVARDGDVSRMEKLLERLSSPQQRKKRLNSKDESKLTPMHYAARYNHYHMIDYLIKNGAHVDIKEEDDATPLHYLAKYKKRKTVEADAADNEDNASSDEEDLPAEETLSCIELLVRHGAQINAQESMGLTPLHLACSRGNTRVVKELLQSNGIALEMTDHQGMTALHLSCLYGRKKIVKMLLEAGSNLRCKDKDMTTPLHLICSEGSLEIAEFLFHFVETHPLTQNRKSSFEIVDDVEIHANNGSQWRPKRLSLANTKPSDPVKTGGILTNKTPSRRDLGLAAVSELLQNVDGDKNLPLHLAIENGHLELVKFCVEKAKSAGIENIVESCRVLNNSCLHLAVKSNNLEIVKFLVDEGADVNARNSSLTTPLFLSCQHNSHKIVKYLLDQGANIEMKDCDFMTPLIIASRYGHLESISWLLEYSADITETDKDDKNCLMWAAEEDQTDAINLLLQKKKMLTMVEERDRLSNTALHLASMRGHTNTVNLLLDHKAATGIRNGGDRTTLHMAALHGRVAIIPNLIARDRSIINSSDEESNTALHLAAIGGHLKCVTTLIQSGANIELRNARQWTPLDCAAAYGWVNIAKAMLEAGTDIQPSGKVKTVLFKVAPLHLACQRGHVDVVKLLLAWKADVAFRAADGRNALDFAIDFSQKDCVLALIKHETWKQSMRNAVINSVTGQMMTPMRKLIMKMEDMALIICNQCVTDNGKKPENDDYAVTLLYEFFDDMHASTEWFERNENSPKIPSGFAMVKTSDSNAYTVFDENDDLTPEAQTYTNKSIELQKNHPLKIMVNSKCENLLLHPVVTGLLNYKWKRYGRYVYYSNLLLYVSYLVCLNVYMLLTPAFYKLDWTKMIEIRSYLANGQVPAGRNVSAAEFNVSLKQDTRPECWFYRSEIRNGLAVRDRSLYEGCQILGGNLLILQWIVLIFSIVHLTREGFQMLNSRLNYLNLTNAVEVSLYLLSLLLTLNFHHYSLDSIGMLTNYKYTSSNGTEFLTGLQSDTGLRQEWQEKIGAFAIFLSWMGLLLFIRKISVLGIFVVMFTDVLKTFAQFFLVFVFFIVGFSFSFTILFGNRYQFLTWYEASVKAIAMTIGELDYSSIFYPAAPNQQTYFETVFTRDVSFILYIIFVFVMTILIMNLLVGLAVGDIIEVQKHATLERQSMQVDLALEVEFTLPSVFRKKLSLRKQTLQVNKYRHSNFIKRFFLDPSNLNLEVVSNAIDEEVPEEELATTTEDKILSGLKNVKEQILDIQTEQAELKQKMHGVKVLVGEARQESRIHTNAIQDNIATSSLNLSNRIDTTGSELNQTNRFQSVETRGRVDESIDQVNRLEANVENTKSEVQQVKRELMAKMKIVQEELQSRKWKAMESRLQDCNVKIEENKDAILSSLHDLRIALSREKLVSRV